ncbi:MFS transporter [Streptacidiphilus sp. P02-A3a]|uniref:MFS transporter n=1 Tax=Streptacidiphilus sp. P02-A3a TaxID=2704468 RepID=UPI0015FC0B26|nr:MFS transporter [Streptacidiphilus sp. P02-A3a]QMU71696.1 MFS transporter [Streptacidiphilus sp. P02-A3a]
MSILRRTFEGVRGLGPGMRVLFVTTLIMQTGTVAFPFLTAYLVGRNRYSGPQVGLVVACYGIGALAADLCAGPLLRALRPRTVMAAGLVGNAVTVACLPFVHGAGELMAATAVWGFCYEIFMPASYLETIQQSSERDRRIAFSFNRLAINLGMGVGPVAGAALFVWRPAVLFWLNACAVLAAAVYLVSRPAADARPAADPGPAPAPTGPGTGRRDRRFWTILALSVPIHCAYALPLTFLSAYVVHDLRLSSLWVGAIFAVSAGSIVLFEIPLNTAMRDTSAFRSLTIGYALAAAGFALMGAARSGPALLGTTLLWTVAEMMVFPSLIHYVSQVSAPGRESRNLGLYSAVMNIGLITAPQLGILLADHTGSASPWYLAGLGIAAALAALLLLSRSPGLVLRTTRPD